MPTALRILLTSLLFASICARAQEAAQPAESAAAEPEAKTYRSEHEIRIGGERIPYVATAGTLIMRDDEDRAIAEFGYTAYFRQGGDPATRPIMFAWNGGPGSASMWLHMGVLGPCAARSRRSRGHRSRRT